MDGAKREDDAGRLAVRHSRLGRSGKTGHGLSHQFALKARGRVGGFAGGLSPLMKVSVNRSGMAWLLPIAS
jgi:hypothetical protein